MPLVFSFCVHVGAMCLAAVASMLAAAALLLHGRCWTACPAQCLCFIGSFTCKVHNCAFLQVVHQFAVYIADFNAVLLPCCLQERVQAAGGTVLNNSGLRVMGILQCTRAIGDKDLRQYGVIPTPDVLSIPRTPEDEFLVLATDGLWDVVSNEVRCMCMLWKNDSGLLLWYKRGTRHVQVLLGARICAGYVQELLD